jgi:hypothetical protein
MDTQTSEKKIPILRYDSNISACLRAVAKGFVYNSPEDYEPSNSYLSRFDEEELITTILLASSHAMPMDIPEVIEEAFQTKTERIMKGSLLMTRLSCPYLADELLNLDLEPPSPQWVRLCAQRNDLKVKTSRAIDADRILGCRKEKIEAFYKEHEKTLKETPPTLIFGADETMLNGNYVTKVIVPEEERESFTVEKPFPHITAMLSQNCVGAVVDPFVIIPPLEKLTPDLQSISFAGKISIASNSKSWMTSQCFCIWAIHFIHWLSLYRENLPVETKFKRALLIIDGATSRSTPGALE